MRKKKKEPSDSLPPQFVGRLPIHITSVREPLIEYRKCLDATGISFRSHLYREDQFTIDSGENWHNMTNKTESKIFDLIQRTCYFHNENTQSAKERFKAVTTSDGNRHAVMNCLLEENVYSPFDDWLITVEPKDLDGFSEKPDQHPANLITKVFRPDFDPDLMAYYGKDAVARFCLDWVTLVGKGLYLRTRKRGTPEASFHFLPTIVGDQGCGKSTFVRGLMPEHLRKLLVGDGLNFSASVADLLMACQKFALVECDELGGFKRKEVNELKSFISSENRSIRPAYGRRQVIVDRHHIVIATVNDLDFLAIDPSGQRRYPIVVVTFKDGWDEHDVKNHMLKIMEKHHADFWGYIKYLVEFKKELASYEHWSPTSRKIREQLCDIHERQPHSVERALFNLVNASEPTRDAGVLSDIQRKQGIPFDAPLDANIQTIMSSLPVDVVNKYSSMLISKTMRKMGWKNGERITIGNVRRYLKIPPEKLLTELRIGDKNVDNSGQTIGHAIDQQKLACPQSLFSPSYVTNTPSETTKMLQELSNLVTNNSNPNEPFDPKTCKLEIDGRRLDPPDGMPLVQVLSFVKRYGKEVHRIFDTFKAGEKQ